MKRFFTHNKDVDRLILMEMAHDELINVCSISKYGEELCDDIFFMNYLRKHYPQTLEFKTKKESYKDYYLAIIYYIKQLKKEFNFDYKIGSPFFYYNILKNFEMLSTEDRKISENYDHFIHNAAKHGNKDIVEYFLNQGEINNVNINLEYGLRGAAYSYNKELIDFFLSRLDPNDINWLFLFYRSCNGRKVDSIKLFASQVGLENIEWDSCLALAARGDWPDKTVADQIPTETLEYIVSHNINDWNKAVEGAAIARNVPLLNYLFDKIKKAGKKYDINKAIIGSSYGGHLDLIKEFVNMAKNKTVINFNEALLAAAKSGKKDVVEYIIAKGAENFKEASHIAKENGNIELYEYLKTKKHLARKGYIFKQSVTGVNYNIKKDLLRTYATTHFI